MNKINEIETLFKANYKQMYHLAIAILHDEDIARDIVHDVFASLLQSNDYTSLTPYYLLSAVRNRSLNYLRNISLHNRIFNLYFLENREYETEEWPDDETLTQTYNIIQNDLTPQCRRIMELRYVDGLKFINVAKIMGISENAVYKHVRQSLVIIRKKLNQYGQI